MHESDLKFKTINTTNPECKDIQLSQFISMAYDNSEHIFLSDRDNIAVHMFLVSSQYHCQLLSSKHLNTNLYKLTLDAVHRNLYVGYFGSRVNVFELT